MAPPPTQSPAPRQAFKMPGTFGVLAAFCTLGFLALGFTHFFELAQAPAFHMDEAWAARFARRIATEPGFWPFQSMVAYTGPWAHYLTALVFKIFGFSILSYRAAGIGMVIGGVALITHALWISRQHRAAALFPWMIAFTPSLVMNHRWVIDMNTFHVLCTGMVILGLVLESLKQRSWWGRCLIFAGIVFGVTGHALYLGPTLALGYWLWITGRLKSKSARGLVTAIAATLTPYFIFISTQPGEKTKGLALTALALGVMGILLGAHGAARGSKLAALEALTQFSPMNSRFRAFFLLPVVAGVIFLVPFAIFFESTWLTLYSVGTIHTPQLVGAQGVLLLAALFYVYRIQGLPRWNAFLYKPNRVPSVSRNADEKIGSDVWLYLLVCVLVIQAIVIKPGPRYFEVPFLIAIMLGCLALAKMPRRGRAFFAMSWCLVGATTLGLNYFGPILRHEQKATDYSIWIYRGSSHEFAAKTPLLALLAQNGCTTNDLTPGYSGPMVGRLKYTLEVLEMGTPSLNRDWDVLHPSSSSLSSLSSPSSPPSIPSRCAWGNQIGIYLKNERIPEAEKGKPVGAIGEYVIYGHDSKK